MSQVFETIRETFDFPFEPYPYQHVALDEAVNPKFDNLLLPLKVGRGKTAMATWLGLYHSEMNGITRLLFIVPASLVMQWSRWLKSVTFHDGTPLDVLSYQGPPAKRKAMTFDHDCIVMSHQIFVKDYQTRLLKELGGDRKLFVTYDESQDGLRKVGNKIWRFFKNFTQNKRTVLLSGTPVSSPMDTYAVVKLLSPNIYPTKRKFEQEHVSEVDYFGNVVSWKNLKKMQKSLYDKAVQIPDSSLDELPPLMVDQIPYELSPKHKKLYNQLVKEEMLKTDNGAIIDATTTQRMFHTLQRFVTSPSKMDLKSIRAQMFNALNTVYMEDDSKLIIFSNYRDTNQGVLEFFEKVGAVGVWGAFTRKQQQINLDAFRDNPDIRVLVGNPRSLGVGTDGLQHVCYREVYTELPLTPTQFEQAVGRVSRTGQTQACIVKCLIALGTIQESLYWALLNKDDLLKQIVTQKLNLRELFST